MIRQYERSDFYRDVEMANGRELVYLGKYCKAMLDLHCPPKGKQDIRLFYQRGLSHVKHRIEQLYQRRKRLSK